MLRLLRLTDFVIVQHVEVELGAGFTVLTGETGAGKSILLDGIGLLLGGRADSSFVRESCTRAELVGLFEVNGSTIDWLTERALIDEAQVDRDADGKARAECWIRRTIDRDGRSRAFINDTPAPVQTLKDLGEMLLDVHGQHASLWLTKLPMQRQLIDDIGGHQPELAKLLQHWQSWQTALEQFQRASAAQSADEQRRERLEWVVGELKLLRPLPGEWEQLSADHKRLSNSAALLQGAQRAHGALTERDNSISSELEELATRLRQLGASDPALEPIAQSLQEASIAVSEASSQLARYLDKTDLDPQRLQQLDERLSALHTAARKFKVDAQALPALLETESRALQDLQAASDLAGLEKRAQEAEAQYLQAAQQLRKQRAKVATTLAKAVTEKIQTLGMKGAQLSVQLSDANPGPSGIDTVEFQISAHASATPRPLGKIASGGELSRVSLALAVVAAAANPVPTLIFDEADAGVGGAVASMIGELMRNLGNNRQVLCVTHLPQVAALAHEHWLVSKQTSAEGVVTSLQRLAKAQRIDELARMLGGAQISANTRKAAMELMR